MYFNLIKDRAEQDTGPSVSVSSTFFFSKLQESDLSVKNWSWVKNVRVVNYSLSGLWGLSLVQSMQISFTLFCFGGYQDANGFILLIIDICYVPIQDNIFKYDMVLFPIHLPGHWTLAILYLRNTRATYYDSYSPHQSECLQVIVQFWSPSSWKSQYSLLLTPPVNRYCISRIYKSHLLVKIGFLGVDIWDLSIIS